MLNDYTGRLEFSPVLRHPGMQVGVKSVAAALMFTWESCEVAGLFSGTLFARNEDLAQGCVVLASEMAVPRMRLRATSRVHPSWLYTSAVLHLPKVGSAPRPPKGADASEQELEKWAVEVAGHVQRIHANAKGGTMVLCSGYDRARLIAHALTALVDDPTSIVLQKPSTGVDGMAGSFRALADKGAKPVAIATGGAWTGLDLTDQQLPPEQDLLLTDLVISALPFNTQRSYLHTEKVQRVGMHVEINFALRKFAQGLGRLVRRKGLQHRNIWILDARLEHVTAATYSRRFLSALSGYTKKFYF